MPHEYGHTMHQSSRREWERERLGNREAQILWVMMNKAAKPHTDREIGRALFKLGMIPDEDPNKFRPAITHLLDEGKLVEIAPFRHCKILRKPVRLTWPSARVSELGGGMIRKIKDRATKAKS